MKFTHKAGWHELIYSLFYPALLGSMIFGFFEKLSYDLISLSKFLVVMLYCADFLYIYVDRNHDDKNIIKTLPSLLIALDAMVALLITIIYWCLHQYDKWPHAWETFGLSLFILSFVMLLYDVCHGYLLRKNCDCDTEQEWISNSESGLHLSIIVISLITAIAAQSYEHKELCAAAGLIIIVILYCLRVFIVEEIDNTNSAGLK